LKYIVIALISLAISGFFYFRTQPALSRGRRWLLFSLRALSLCILLLLLISPILYFLRQNVQKQQIILLSDISASLDLKSGKQSKKDFLKPLGEQAAKKFEQAGYELLSYGFARGLEAATDNTLLMPALAELTGKHDFNRVKGIVLLSDGWLRDESLQGVRQLGCPFYVIADTIKPSLADLAIVKTVANRHAWRGEPTIIRAELSSSGYSGPATVEFLLGGKKISAKNLQLKEGEIASVDFNQRFNQTGFYPYTLQVSAAGVAERSQNNNSYPGAIEVLSDKQRVLVLSDSPAWDNKFIVDALAENERWEVAHYRVRDGQAYAGEKAVASLPDANLAALVIVNNGSLRLSGEPLNFVNRNHQKGVGILFQGLPLTELASILPLQRSNISASYQGFLELSPAASSYPMLGIDAAELQQIPPLDYFYVTAAKGSEVLATLSNPQKSPAIAVRSAGNSRVLSLAFLNLWKWQLQSKSGGYRQLLANSVTWLSNKSSSGYSAIYNSNYFLGEQIDLRLRAEDSIRSLRLDLNPELRILDADGKEMFKDFMTLTDGEYASSLTLDKPGQYSFEIRDKVSGETSKGRFNVSNASLEDRDFDYNLPLLAWLASDTRGQLLSPAALQAFNPLPAQNIVRERRQDFPLYRKWYIPGLFILSFCLELFFRRRWGLL